MFKDEFVNISRGKSYIFLYYYDGIIIILIDKFFKVKKYWLIIRIIEMILRIYEKYIDW